MGSETSKEDSSHGGSAHGQYATDVAAFEEEQIKMREISRMDQTIRSRLHQGVRYNMKVLICGERGTGKTMLWRRLQGQPFVAKLGSTPEIQSATINWSSPLAARTSAGKDDVVKVEVWDVVDHALLVDRSSTESVAADMVYNLTGEVEEGRHSLVPADASVVDIYHNTHAVLFLINPAQPSSLHYVREKYPLVPEHVSILLVLNFKDQTIGTVPAVSFQSVQELCAEVRSFRSNCANDDVTALETSLLDCYGLLHLHHYLDVPFLRLKQHSLQEQLVAIERDLHSCHADIVHKVQCTKYEDYLRQYNARKRERLQHESAEHTSPLTTPVLPTQVVPVTTTSSSSSSSSSNGTVRVGDVSTGVSTTSVYTDKSQLSHTTQTSLLVPAEPMSVCVTETGTTPTPHPSMDAHSHGHTTTHTDSDTTYNNSNTTTPTYNDTNTTVTNVDTTTHTNTDTNINNSSAHTPTVITPPTPPSTTTTAPHTAIDTTIGTSTGTPVTVDATADTTITIPTNTTTSIADTTTITDTVHSEPAITETHTTLPVHTPVHNTLPAHATPPVHTSPPAPTTPVLPAHTTLPPPTQHSALLDSFLDSSGSEGEEVSNTTHTTRHAANTTNTTTTTINTNSVNITGGDTSVSGVTGNNGVSSNGTTTNTTTKTINNSGSDSDTPHRTPTTRTNTHGSSHTTMSKMLGESDSSSEEGERGNKLNQKVSFGVKALRSVKDKKTHTNTHTGVNSVGVGVTSNTTSSSGGLRKAKSSMNKIGVGKFATTVTDLEEVDL